MFSIDQIFEMLSWNSDEEAQEKGIEDAGKIKHLSVLIQPIESKSLWENCAKVLVEKSDEELCPYFTELFKWLKDLNWPGAYLIYDRLKAVPSKDIEIHYNISLLSAEETDDRTWKQVLLEFKRDSMMCD